MGCVRARGTTPIHPPFNPPAGKKLPIKRAVKYSNLTADGFSFTLAYNGSALHGLPPGPLLLSG